MSIAAAPSGSPRDLVETFHAALIQTMKSGDHAGFDARFAELEPAVNQTFALGFMARTSVGRAWSDLSADQQSAYLAKYAEWSIATFAGRFKKWTGEHFELVSVSEPESGTVTIDSELVKNDGSTVSFRYKLREGNAGWQVVDLHIDGVSQLALTRSQYAGVLKQQGMEGLLATLQQKIDDQKASSAE